MKLSADVYLVGGGDFNGFGLSNDMDSHIYAVDGGSEIALIDCGMATTGSVDRIISNMKNDGMDPEKLTKIFLTHYHIDHCGGLKEWQNRFEVEAYIDESASESVKSGDTGKTGFRLAQKSGIYPSDYFFEKPKSILGLKANDVVELGNLKVRFIPTPGHCDGHSSYLIAGEKKYLFTGDCVFAGGEIALSNTEDCDIRKYRESILTLDNLEFDALLPGHGAIALQNGKGHVGIAADAFRTLSLPKNFI
jgi:glyoxylase-like metal-dependent hydrolase (beta-lactamase superfamily II)